MAVAARGYDVVIAGEGPAVTSVARPASAGGEQGQATAGDHARGEDDP